VGDFDRNQITRTFVDKVEGEARTNMRAQRVRELDTDKRLLYEIIHTEGEVEDGDLHRQYDDRAQDPVSRSTRRKYLARLSEYELVEETGESRGKRYLTA